MVDTPPDNLPYTLSFLCFLKSSSKCHSLKPSSTHFSASLHPGKLIILFSELTLYFFHINGICLSYNTRINFMCIIFEVFFWFCLLLCAKLGIKLMALHMLGSALPLRYTPFSTQYFSPLQYGLSESRNFLFP